ncbi:hypothetical protein Q8G35_22385 [Peribacillus simplex]|uniref:Uncharacterized protein n=2 Tax=Peribacillus TaxID=2675229 RepID=A0AA90P586_9BACI|nr:MULTISPECIES: hypothetical protein [Peribacillus]MDP1421052.1 hypothetical protein [Peribacillus simplex]MDP1453819.1 hypothetical protein [Peribacillus frigoritolerans]
MGKGYYLDGHAPDMLFFGKMGILEFIILNYPYIYFALAVALEKRRINQAAYFLSWEIG